MIFSASFCISLRQDNTLTLSKCRQTDGGVITADFYDSWIGIGIWILSALCKMINYAVNVYYYYNRTSPPAPKTNYPYLLLLYYLFSDFDLPTKMKRNKMIETFLSSSLAPMSSSGAYLKRDVIPYENIDEAAKTCFQETKEKKKMHALNGWTERTTVQHQPIPNQSDKVKGFADDFVWNISNSESDTNGILKCVIDALLIWSIETNNKVIWIWE